MITLLPKSWLAQIGSKGGKTSGASKRRSPEHYAKMVTARNAKRLVDSPKDKP